MSVGNGFEVVSIKSIPLDDWSPSKFRWGFHPRVERGVKRGHTLVESDHGLGKTYEGMILAKFWLQQVALARVTGFRAVELRKVERLVVSHQQEFLEAWHEYFGS